MRLYATKKQCEQIIIALMKEFSDDEDALKMVKIVNDAMLMQCKCEKKKEEERGNKK